MDHRGRQQRLQHSLSNHHLDALMVVHPPNIRYLCGFTGSAGILVITGKNRVLFTDGRYTGQARAEVKGAKIV
ncbi:MAG TPA: aminopeptidase P family N-terminal domain-containing protein, partial [Terriglobales bacterium]|nr:aminopeptidase P family N-terminal domain-containing protein [Terriglobales bacterium]